MFVGEESYSKNIDDGVFHLRHIVYQCVIIILISHVIPSNACTDLENQ